MSVPNPIDQILALGQTASDNGAPSEDLFDYMTAALAACSDVGEVGVWLIAFIREAAADEPARDHGFYAGLGRFTALFADRLNELLGDKAMHIRPRPNPAQ